MTQLEKKNGQVIVIYDENIRINLTTLLGEHGQFGNGLRNRIREAAKATDKSENDIREALERNEVVRW